MTSVTVPGANGISTALNFSTGDNSAFQTELLNSLLSTFSNPSLYVSLNPSSTAPNPAQPSLLAIENTPAAAIVLGSGFDGLINTASGPSTIQGNSGQNQSVVAGSGGTTFWAGVGESGTLAAAGGNNTFMGPSAGGGNWTLLLDGAGHNTVVAGSGDHLIQDSSGENNRVYLGSGADTLGAFGADTIVGGTGQGTVFQNGTGAVLYGENGTLEVVNNGGANTVMAGVGPETVFANVGGGTYVGDAQSSGTMIFVNQPGSVAGGASTFTAGLGNTTAFALSGSGLYNAGHGAFTLLVENGTDTIAGTSGMNSVTVFAESGGDVVFNGDANGNILVAGSGNTTLNASGSAVANVLFNEAGAGNAATLMGGSYYNYFIGSAANATMVGGSSHNIFQFINGADGGNDLIQGWNSKDSLDFYGYGTTQPTQTTASGSTVISLSDGTKITIAGVTSVPTSQIHLA